MEAEASSPADRTGVFVLGACHACSTPLLDFRPRLWPEVVLGRSCDSQLVGPGQHLAGGTTTLPCIGASWGS
eukprot:12364802-Alexandrium_andersonii.AAC.1